MQTATKPVAIVNADGLILGRMATYIAKRLLNGEEIIIVNAEKAVLSGKKQAKGQDAKEFLEVGSPRMGPFHYRSPERLVRKSVRGMLPFKQPKGKQAYKRLRVYLGVPDEVKDHKLETIEQAQARKLTCSSFTVGELAKEIGWNPSE
jgi:large subunit ribosomal protein L13